jgi:hypothetical protein
MSSVNKTFLYLSKTLLHLKSEHLKNSQMRIKIFKAPPQLVPFHLWIVRAFSDMEDCGVF